MAQAALLQVLVVDDEAPVRLLLSEMLRGQYAVTTAATAVEAMAVLGRTKTDIIIADIRMPGTDGLGLLRWVRAMTPELPFILISGHADKEVTLAALREGAFDLIEKPFDEAQLQVAMDRARDRCLLRRMDEVIYEEAKSLRGTQLGARLYRPKSDLQRPDYLVAVGGSLGAPEAWAKVLLKLPVGLPPIVTCLHMAKGFTKRYAEVLDDTCTFPVAEIEDGMALAPGRAYIAPGGVHTRLGRVGLGYVARLSSDPVDSLYKPSVDVFFSSVAMCAGNKAVGVILTGMGKDGALGLLEMKQKGATTLAQDEASCSVYGMPKRAVECGAVDTTQPLDTMNEGICRALERMVAAKR